MGERGTLERLERGREWDLAPTLASGGVVVFPHAGVLDCGHQVAAAVHGCLDSGADRVIVISVLHAFTDEMQEARTRVSAGEDPSEWPFWGIQGPGIEGRDEWRDDHSLISFRHFWAAETSRRGVPGPEVVERYPYLAGGHPERLPGIEELAALAEDAVDRLHRRPLPSRDRIRRSSGARTRARRRWARARPSDDRGRDRATRQRRLRRLRRALRRGQERRARCRGRLSLPPRGAARLDRRHDLHRRRGAVRRAGSDLGRRSARRVAGRLTRATAGSAIRDH